MASKPRMTLEQYAKLYGLDLAVQGHYNTNGFANTSNHIQWAARLVNTEIHEGEFLKSCTGFGPTPEEAIDDCAANISGKVLVVQRYTEPRREIEVGVEFIPMTITGALKSLS